MTGTQNDDTTAIAAKDNQNAAKPFVLQEA